MAFARRTVHLHAKLIGDELTRKLLLPQEQMRGEQIHLDLTPLELGTLTEQIAAATMATADSGLWQVDNEGRELTGKGPLPNGEAKSVVLSRAAALPRARRSRVLSRCSILDPLITPQNGHRTPCAISDTSLSGSRGKSGWPTIGKHARFLRT